MHPAPVRVAVAYHSGSGRTERQAQAVARGAASVDGAVSTLHSVAVLDADLWQALDTADGIVFGTPTFMGSPSGPFMTFVDASSKVWIDGMRWRDKVAAGFTNSGSISGDKLNSLQDLAVLAAQHGMLWVGVDLMPDWAPSSALGEAPNRLGSWLGAMAHSHPHHGLDETPPEPDLATAEYLGCRVARIAQRLVAGRRAIGAVVA